MSPQQANPVVDFAPLAEETATPVERLRIPFQRVILFGLNRLNKPMYQGTVPTHVVARRRAQGKAARKARRAHR